VETGEGAWLNRPASEVGVGVDYKVSEVEDGEDYEEFKDKEDSNKQFEGA